MYVQVILDKSDAYIFSNKLIVHFISLYNFCLWFEQDVQNTNFNLFSNILLHSYSK